MAIAIDHRPSRQTGSLTRTLRDVSARIVRAWRRHRIERELEGLSYDQRKDIGFRSSERMTR